MRHIRNAARPRVFLSFAGNDRVIAERLRHDLRDHGIDAFVDEQDIAWGDNFVLLINEALTQSDYYVLLWSHASVDRPWVNAEWSAAFAHEVRERRSFLFIVRLDTTPLPPLLAPRRYLDALHSNWEAIVNELAATWCRDRAVGEPVLPAPSSSVARSDEADRPTIVVYVRNRALAVAHVVAVPEKSTGQELEKLVRDALALPVTETKFAGAVGMSFYYQLENAGKSIPLDETPLAELHVTDNAMIDLVVQVESFGPKGSFGTVVYRKGVSTGLSPALTRSLINSALGHLIPMEWDGRAV